MAWAAKCDRCGKYFDWNQNDTSGFAFLTYDYLRAKGRYKIDSDEYDLCPECVAELKTRKGGTNVQANK